MRAAGVLAAVVAMSVGASAAPAADYYVIQGNVNQITLIDQNAIAQDANGRPSAPVVAVRRQPRTLNLDFAYAVVQTEFDCDNSRVASMSVKIYQADGQEAAQQAAKAAMGEWVAVAPGSQGGAALKFVCAKPEDRKTLGFSMRGASLSEIVTALYAGPWPGDPPPAKPQ